MKRNLPDYFKSILWFADFNKVDLKKDRDLILFQALEKGRIEHLKYLTQKLGYAVICNFAKKNSRKFSRKSILSLVNVLFAGRH